MQQPRSAKFLARRRGPFFALLTAGVTAVTLAWVGGCGPSDTGTQPKDARPFRDAALRVSCPDAEFARVIAPLARAWASRHGAKVEVVTDPMAAGDAADVGVLPLAELGAWADRGELVPVPTALRAAGNAYQRQDVIDAYRERLANWGRQTLALPLAGGGAVIVYRADRLADPAVREKFAARFGRPPDRPATWEDFADLAEFFAALDGKPSLPPLPDSADRLAELFFRVAACYDRQAMNDIVLARRQKVGNFEAEVLSFQFRTDTGRPRLDAPGFVAAAAWLARLRAAKCLPDAPAANPAAALADGTAALAVLTLAELAKLPREGGKVPDRFAVAPLPGTRTFTDPATGKPAPAAAGVNYVPYYGTGRLGVVRSRCANPDAAFDLLADLGGPARSLELVSAVGLGVGPFRDSQLSGDRLLIWTGYGFDEARSKALLTALQQNVRADVKNPTIGLRGPDHAALTAAVADVLRRVARGEEPDAAKAMARANAAWDELDAKVPAEKRLAWRRRAAGLD